MLSHAPRASWTIKLMLVIATIHQFMAQQFCSSCSEHFQKWFDINPMDGISRLVVSRSQTVCATISDIKLANFRCSHKLFTITSKCFILAIIRPILLASIFVLLYSSYLTIFKCPGVFSNVLEWTFWRVHILLGIGESRLILIKRMYWLSINNYELTLKMNKWYSFRSLWQPATNSKPMDFFLLSA